MMVRIFILQFLKPFHLQLQKRFHANFVVIHIFSKIVVFAFVTNASIPLAVFLSKILLPETAVIFRGKVFPKSYHYQNRLDEIRQKYDLAIKPEVYFKLKSDLKKIDKALNTINIQYERKRLINISYLIKRILGEYDKTEADKIELKLSDKTLNFYDDWFETFQSIQ